MSKPNLQAVKKHFLNAKTIECIENKMKIDVTNVNDFEFNSELQSWTSIGGAVTFWKDGQFAEIINSVSKKPCKCENCGCNKSKTIKKNPNRNDFSR